MAFFNFEINTVEEAKMAKAMLETFISMNESKKEIVTETKPKKEVSKVVVEVEEIKTVVEPKVEEGTKPKKEIVKFRDIQLLCRSAVNKCCNKKEERKVRIYISELAERFGTSKGVIDIDKSNYINFYNELYEYMDEKPF